MGEERRLAEWARNEWTNILSWGGNVACSVLIVFCNKVLMGSNGYGFHFATTLSALHYVVCGITVLLSQARKEQEQGKGGKLPLKDLILFTAVADTSIISLNLSLLLNPVTTYQVAKLLVIPFVCCIERFFLGSMFSRQVLATIALVVFGVGIVTVEEFKFEGTPLGMSIAAVSVAASGMQQILVRTMQQKHGLKGNEMLSYVAPAQAVSLLLLGPLVDKLVSDQWVVSYNWNVPAINCIALSCALAIGVNVTQFLCLGRFSAVSFQVLGHSKTILVLLGSCLFLGETASPKKVTGMVLAVTGMILYGHASMSGGRGSAKAGGAVELVEGGSGGGGASEAGAERQPLLPTTMAAGAAANGKAPGSAVEATAAAGEDGRRGVATPRAGNSK